MYAHTYTCVYMQTCLLVVPKSVWQLTEKHQLQQTTQTDMFSDYETTPSDWHILPLIQSLSTDLVNTMCTWNKKFYSQKKGDVQIISGPHCSRIVMPQCVSIVGSISLNFLSHILLLDILNRSGPHRWSCVQKSVYTMMGHRDIHLLTWHRKFPQ